ncbi:hypothetical protein FNO01nite_26180 [Flavobacterium noncentrifugens]|uniref:Uncharacterized protein n=1 Tax=Flavobacterium noncentrifugens TaxID=1128970 RepID=A0A1G8ZGC2_9FLAO|nr:hypothetical protein [Flavobacterium noncentrifugens]GEP51946.1 hypothetical protein FNO01nite_26180 [Flavobacterium noncentrifugens]SDK14111.1 hypothetical protein SAMN04487935_2581 [Flavobacterium noncentrifugens]
MKTSRQPSFPTLENEFLENILRQTVSHYAVVQMFYNKPKPGSQAVLVIYLQQKQDADLLQSRPWVEKLKNQYQIFVYCVYSTRLHHKFSLGHPFIETYCRPPAAIYQNEAAGEPLLIRRNWTKYKEKFYAFEERFYNGHEVRLGQLQKLIAEDAVNSVFTAYERLIGYDLDYLEDLYIGHTVTLKGLNERINNLIPYIPEIQRYFVRKNNHSYYLTELFAKAKKGIDEGEVIFDDDLFEAVGIVEKGLYDLIETRLAALKKWIKKGSNEKQELCIATYSQKDEILEMAIATVLKSVEAEQIYLFHQTTYGEHKTYYLLLIARGVGNEKLKLLTQSLKGKAGLEHDFVLIAHERYWIQKNLFQYQQFFSQIIQSKNLIYSSGDCHPEFHWLKPHEPHHGDLFLYCKATEYTAMQFFAMADPDRQNDQGLEYLFTLFFLSFCRTYISAKTFYTPNSLSCRVLWQLCVYADANLQRYDYLFGQFPGDFFYFLDKYMTLHHRLSHHSKEEVELMKMIVEKLGKALKDLVVGGRLLDDRQIVSLRSQ